jgi:hypothetical protein
MDHLSKRETPILKRPIDTVGLSLLFIWVGSLQLMLDKGKELDWFNSSTIVVLAVVALVSFVVFLVWELTDEHPVVDLKLFAKPNFISGCLVLVHCLMVFVFWQPATCLDGFNNGRATQQRPQGWLWHQWASSPSYLHQWWARK